MRRRKVGDSAWHAYARGARRLALFYENADYLEFLSLMYEAAAKAGCLVFGYCLMSNHYHLLLQGTSAQLSKCMYVLNRKYALYHNRKYNLGGHVFDGPYQAYQQKGLWWLLYKLAYVFMNPVTAGLVARPEMHRWSSYREFLRQGNEALTFEGLLEKRNAGPFRDEARKYFDRLIGDKELFKRKATKAGPTAREVNLHQFEWLLTEARQRSDELGGESPLVVATLWGQACGIPPRTMASRWKGHNIDDLHYAILRLKRRFKKEPELASRLSPP